MQQQPLVNRAERNQIIIAAKWYDLILLHSGLWLLRHRSAGLANMVSPAHLICHFALVAEQFGAAAVCYYYAAAAVALISRL